MLEYFDNWDRIEPIRGREKRLGNFGVGGVQAPALGTTRSRYSERSSGEWAGRISASWLVEATNSPSRV